MSSTSEIAHHFLVVEHDLSIARLLQHLLRNDGHRVSAAHDGRQGLTLLAADRPDLVLLDLDMPAVHGFEVCRRIKQDPATRLIPVVILTGQTSSEARLRAWELGADEFLPKPFHPVEVMARCRSLLKVTRVLGELDSAQAVVFAFARAVEAKSPHTLGHAERVTTYALAMADEVGLGEAEREVLRRGTVLHDVGKISIPDSILNKPGPLTPAEYGVVKEHPLQGVRIVEPLRSIREVIPLIRWHHERLDGTGYPDGLRGDAIPPLVRLLAVADVYDALASARPYRPALTHPECLELLHRNAAGGGLDVAMVRVFEKVLGEGKAGLALPGGPSASG
jgi:putative two-component system response regulator